MAFRSLPMLDHYLYAQGVDRKANETKDRLPAKAKKAVQGNIRVLRIPQEVGRGEIVNVRQRSENHADNFLAMPSLETAGDVAT